MDKAQQLFAELGEQIDAMVRICNGFQADYYPNAQPYEAPRKAAALFEELKARLAPLVTVIRADDISDEDVETFVRKFREATKHGGTFVPIEHHPDRVLAGVAFEQAGIAGLFTAAKDAVSSLARIADELAVRELKVSGQAIAAVEQLETVCTALLGPVPLTASALSMLLARNPEILARALQIPSLAPPVFAALRCAGPWSADRPDGSERMWLVDNQPVVLVLERNILALASPPARMAMRHLPDGRYIAVANDPITRANVMLSAHDTIEAARSACDERLRSNEAPLGGPWVLA